MAHANTHDFASGCQRLHANPPVPGRKNPEPDQPDPPGREDDETPLPDEDDTERHRPGRDHHPVVLRARPECRTGVARSAARSMVRPLTRRDMAMG